MRLKLTLESKESGTLLPFNYQYPVSSFIYRTIGRADNEFSIWLHEKGFNNGNKKFKFFTFSAFKLPKFTIQNGFFKLHGKDLEIVVSILSPKALEKFVMGLFESQQVKIFGRGYESNFVVKFVESTPEPEFTECVKFRTLSPVVLSKKGEFNGRISETYLKPDNEDYTGYMTANIKEKYTVYSEHFGDMEKIPEWDSSSLSSVKVSGDWKSKLITIKEGTENETKVKGCLYDFEVSGKPEALKLIYNAGVGKLNSLGFGCVTNERI